MRRVGDAFGVVVVRVELGVEIKDCVDGDGV